MIALASSRMIGVTSSTLISPTASSAASGLKEWKAHGDRLQTDSNASHHISDLFQDPATRGGRRSAEKVRSTVRTCSWTPSTWSGVDAQENDRTSE